MKQSIAMTAMLLVAYGFFAKRSHGDPADTEVWPGFRGANVAGVFEGGSLPPLEFGPNARVRWKIELPSGHASPSVWRDHVIVSSFDADAKQLAVTCLDRSTGQMRWQEPVMAETIEKGHPSFNPASSTPATNGQVVVAYFGSAGLLCYDMNGDLKWHYPMPLAKSYSGSASSPMIVGEKVIFYRGTYGDHFLLALDLETGEVLWKHDFTARVLPSSACSATPVVHRDQVIVHCLDGVTAHALENGQPVWWVDATTTATASPVLGEKHVYVATWNQVGESSQVPEHPEFAELLEDYDDDDDAVLSKSEYKVKLGVFVRPEGLDAPQSYMPLSFRFVDRDKDGKIDQDEWERTKQMRTRQRAAIRQHGLLAIELGGTGDVTDSHVQVLAKQSIPEVPSPIYRKGRVYIVKNGGILTCVDTESGKRVYRRRIKTTGTHYASPVLCHDVLYVASGDGKVVAVDATDDRGTVLATAEFGEPIYATPAIAGDTMLIRTSRHLYAIEMPAGAR